MSDSTMHHSTGNPRPAGGAHPSRPPTGLTIAAATTEREPASGGPAQRSSLPTWRHLQGALGAIWLADGVLQLQPWMFTKSFVAQVLLPSAQGQPGWVAVPTTSVARFIEPHIAAWNALFAAIQVGIGAGILLGALASRPRLLKAALGGSFVWAALVWWLSEGLGGVLTGASPLAGAPGAVLLYAIVGMLVWPRRQDERAAVQGDGHYGGVGERGIRAIWAGLWILSALLLLEPSNQTPGAVKGAVAAAASGEPSWLGNLLRPVGVAVGGVGSWVDFALAVVMVVIGIGVAVSWHPKALLVAASVLALVIWVLAQGFGGILTGHGTDPNSGPLWVLLAGCLWAQLEERQGTAPRRSAPVLSVHAA